MKLSGCFGLSLTSPLLCQLRSFSLVNIQLIVARAFMGRKYENRESNTDYIEITFSALHSLPTLSYYVQTILYVKYMLAVTKRLMILFPYVYFFISIYRLIKNETGRAILRVISGSRAFKVVLFARLTPIPFGLQNTIFGVSLFAFN